jgi:hypothetical protein
MFLELTAFYYPDDFDPESAENLKQPAKCTKEILIVNTDHIVGFNQNDNGNAMLRLTNGEVFEIDVTFTAFREIMEGMQISKDVFVSGDN